MDLLLRLLRLTVRIARVSLPSITVRSLIERAVAGAGSSLRMVPVTAVVVPILYPVPGARVKATVSLLSTVASALGSTVTVAMAEFWAKVTLVPIFA